VQAGCLFRAETPGEPGVFFRPEKAPTRSSDHEGALAGA